MRSRAVVSCSVREHLRIGRSLGAFALMMTVVFSASTTSLASAEKQLGPRTPLQTAILAGDEQRARELVDQGAAVDEGLISAARTANGPLLELLIASGADAASFFGARALVVAMLVDSDDAVKVLRSNGAHLEAEDEAGRTVLVWASGQKRLGPLVRTAIAAGADLEAASRTGESALMTASRFARVSSVRMLLKAGAPVDARDRDGWTPLMFAVRSQSTKIVDMLLDAGADPEAESTLGWTPLMLAAREGKARIVNRLLRAGADPDRRTEMGYEPLVRAVQGGHGAAARRLLARGAEVGDGTPGDPIWWARELRRQHLRKLLVSAGREEG